MDTTVTTYSLIIRFYISTVTSIQCSICYFTSKLLSPTLSFSSGSGFLFIKKSSPSTHPFISLVSARRKMKFTRTLLPFISIPVGAPFVHAALRNSASEKFFIDGSRTFPKHSEVQLPSGETYAGLMPISADPHETRQLFFWFLPSFDPTNEQIMIWTNGGPGAESVFRALRQDDMPLSWRALANVLFVDQPIGVGFSQGTLTSAMRLGWGENLPDSTKSLLKRSGSRIAGST